MKTHEIYVVETEGDCEDRSQRKTIGYAVGNPEDIKKFYDERKMWNLYLKKVQVVNIIPQAIRERKELKQEREDLEKRLGGVKTELDRVEGRLRI